MIFHFAYQLGIHCYGAFMRLAALFNSRAAAWVNGRHNWETQLQNAIDPDADYVWFHCASLGEFEQGRPLIEAYKSQYPKHKILLSFFSPSGYNIRKNYELAEYVCYLPLDTTANAQQFIDLVQPKRLFLIKYEFWYNHLRLAIEQGCEAYLVAGIFRPNQWIFAPWGAPIRKTLQQFKQVFVQNDSSLALLKAQHIDAQFAPDTRFDRVLDIAQQAQDIEIVEHFKAEQDCLVMGSTWPSCERMLLDHIDALSGTKVIIAPHDLNEERIEQLKKDLGDCQRYSQYKHNKESQFLIIDNMGLLSSIYRYADFTYVGGGFDSCVHNVLEPTVFGVATAFGPAHTKTQEAYDLIEIGGGFAINTPADFKGYITALDQPTRKKIRHQLKDYFAKNQGGTQTIMSALVGPLR